MAETDGIALVALLDELPIGYHARVIRCRPVHPDAAWRVVVLPTHREHRGPGSRAFGKSGPTIAAAADACRAGLAERGPLPALPTTREAALIDEIDAMRLPKQQSRAAKKAVRESGRAAHRVEKRGEWFAVCALNGARVEITPDGVRHLWDGDAWDYSPKWRDIRNAMSRAEEDIAMRPSEAEIARLRALLADDRDAAERDLAVMEEWRDLRERAALVDPAAAEEDTDA